MIYTSNFATFKSMGPEFCGISIAAFPPEGWDLGALPSLFTPVDLIKAYKENKLTDAQYTRRYEFLVLDKLSPLNIIATIDFMSSGLTPVLLCYERADRFCHRHIVANWLSYHMEVQIEEYKKPGLKKLGLR